MPKALSSLLLVVLLLAACGGPASAPAPTAVPSATLPPPTPTGTTVQPTATVATASPLPQIPTATVDLSTPTLESTLEASLAPLLPTGVPSQEATALPQPIAGSGVLQILTPGPLSKVVSPIQLRSFAIPGYEGKVRIELFGEDGRLLDRTIFILTNLQTWSYFYQEIPFEVHAAGELGRLSLSTLDASGRTTALYSVHLLLLAQGTSEINPPGNLMERVVIDRPAGRDQGSGGLLHVSGSMRPLNGQPVVVELITPDGASLSSRLVSVPPAPDDSYVPFSVDVSYSLAKRTSVLLVVRQPDDRISGGMYLFSQAVTLNP